jgi:ABC-type branched-subunit amino acid transport system permease subunit
MSQRKSDQLPAPEGGNAPPASAALATTPGAPEHHDPSTHGRPGWSAAKANLWVPLAILALLPIAALVESQAVGRYNARIVTLIGYNVILAVSLQLINGVSGQFSLGHAGFMAVGAYLAAYPAKQHSHDLKDPAAVVLFYVALAVVVAIMGGVVYGLLRGSAMLKRINPTLPGVALLALIVWIAVDISKASGASDAGTAVPAWCVWSRGVGLLQDLFAGILDHGSPAAARISGVLPAGAAQAICFVALLVGAGLCAAATGLIVGLPALRLRGDYLAIATLGMAEIIRIVIQNSRPLGGALGLTGIPRYTSFPWLYGCVILTVLCVWRVTYSARGRVIMAVREDEIAASAIGVSTTRQKVTAFVLGAFFAGVAGALFALNEFSITPTRFTLDRSIEVVVMVTLGGLGSISGAIIAAIVLTILPEALRGVAEYRMIIYSALLIVMMLLRPQGLMGTRELPSPVALVRRWFGGRGAKGATA